MESLEEIAQRISEGNRASRERFSSLATRTAKAIFEKDQDALNDIVNDATNEAGSGIDGDQTVEAGDTDGAAGIQGTTESPAAN